VLILLALSGCAALEQGDDEKPNIVFILTDDMRLADFEYMTQTRQLFTQQGLIFENAFVTHSLCCPSRASTLRGQYTHNHQVLTNARPEGGFEKFRSMGHEDSTVATWLKSGGYQTVLIGKYLNGYGRADPSYVPPGWEEWYAKPGGFEYYDYELNENGELVSYGSEEEAYLTDVLARQASDYVRRAADSPDPFFMYLAPTTPHSPLVPAPRHENEYPDAKAPRPSSFDEPDVGDKPAWMRDLPRLGSADAATTINEVYVNRLRMLLSLDEMVAGLMEELEATGELDNTYIFFTSDNGYQLGEHRISGKRTVYEEAVRVPLAALGPGVPAGDSVEQLVLNIDFAPTFAELVGVSMPEFGDGRSLVPLLRGTLPTSWRSGFLIEHWNGGGGQPQETPTYAAIRTESHKYVEYNTGEKELYDLSADPYELDSIYESAEPALVNDLSSRLEALKDCGGQTCREAEDGP
jgi:N-acetylglucosamine-6-sulfatase